MLSLTNKFNLRAIRSNSPHHLLSSQFTSNQSQDFSTNIKITRKNENKLKTIASDVIPLQTSSSNARSFLQNLNSERKPFVSVRTYARQHYSSRLIPNSTSTGTSSTSPINQTPNTTKLEGKICTSSSGENFLLFPLSSKQSFSLFGNGSSKTSVSLKSKKNQHVRFFSSDSSDGNGNNGDDGNGEKKDETTPEEPQKPADTSSTDNTISVEDKNQLVTLGDAETGEKSHARQFNMQAYKSIQQGVVFPEKVLVVPMYKRPFFPNLLVPIVINDWDLVEALIAWKKKQPYVGVFMAKETEDKAKILNANQIHTTGVLATINSIAGNTRGQQASVIFSGYHRVQITSIDKIEGAKIIANIKKLEDEPFDKDDREIKAYHREIIATLRDMVKAAGQMYKEHLLSSPTQNANAEQPGEIADMAAAFTNADGAQLQDIIETLNVKERQKKALTLLKQELKQLEFQQKLNKQIEDSLNQTQRKFFLQEQLKAIKKELGLERDEKTSITEEFQNRLKEKKVPEAVMKVINDEMNKISTLEPSSSEYNVTRNYLDWLTILPWGVYGKETFDVKRAQVVLDEDHYGLKDVKERILEFIAVGKLKSNVQGKILCFVGPPGVGKTSIGKSIARALNREFFRFSVGGLWDTAEIKGHRRTYIGAMPGKLIQCMKTVKTSNPVILIDEIDKMGGMSHHGDPASAMLEVLDPEQNKNFMDHYLDVPFDLSKVLFICTANIDDTIPRPLLDRMEVIKLSGYITEEKINIAKKYLVPTAKKDHGVSQKNVEIKDSAIRQLIQFYCREAGVRNLQRHIEKILRKVAYKMVKGTKNKIIVEEDNLDDFVGKPVFSSEKYYEITPPGVVTGLAWTALGGSALYIEAVTDKLVNKPGIRITGMLGDVMKESNEIAYTFSKIFLGDLTQNNNKFFETAAIHMHVPEGATKKDGPSAGVTMVTALLSLALKKSVKPHLAMTGEITLTGKVLAIGGVKEKTLAARREGVTTMIIPKENKKDWDELDDHVKEGIEIHFAETYADVYHNAFEFEAVAKNDPNQTPVYPPRLSDYKAKKPEKKKLGGRKSVVEEAKAKKAQKKQKKEISHKKQKQEDKSTTEEPAPEKEKKEEEEEEEEEEEKK